MKIHIDNYIITLCMEIVARLRSGRMSFTCCILL